MDDFEGLKTSMKEVTADVVKITRKLELEVEPKDVAELQSHDKTADEELFLLTDEQSGLLREISWWRYYDHC
jgi:hypothetical protein